MSKIVPINGHVLIEPVKHESFMASQKETYQEAGTVIDLDEDYIGMHKGGGKTLIERGDTVFFDAWLGKKYPRPNEEGFYWLIRISDIVAYERQVPEQHV